MIELRALGTLDLRQAGGPDLDALLVQPKRCALLAYLACARPRGFQHREKLLPVFWPELDTARARRALRQSVHYLRETLGADVVVSRGSEEIGLAEGALWSDVAAFESAAHEGRYAEAADLYRGDLLPGFFVDGSAEFESWLEAERARLRAIAAAVFWQLADTCQSAGDGRTAIDWARKAAALAPTDETVMRRMLTLMHAAGDSAAAVEAYESYARRLAQEYEIAPSQETQALVDAIRDDAGDPNHAVRRQRPLGDVEWVRSEPTQSTIAPQPPESGPSAPLHIRPVAARLGSRAVLLAAAVARPFRAVKPPASSADTLAGNAIAVLPFRTAGSDPSFAELGSDIVELLATRFSGEAGPRALDPRAVLAAWRQAGFTADALSQDSAAALASRLGADHVLTGSAHVVDGRLTVHATLVDVSSRRVRATAAAEGAADSLLTVIDAAAARLIGLGAREHRTRLDVLTTTSQQALQAYLSGRAAVRTGRYETAVREYDRALQADSTFALAAIELIDAMGWTSSPPGVRARAIRAVNRGYARLSERDRAHVHVYYGSRIPPDRVPDVGELLRHRERFIQLAPDRPEAWYVLADQLFHAGGILALPDARERAEGGFRRAFELDSTLAGSVEHLLQLAATSGDIAQVRRYRDVYLRQHANADDADFVRWLAAHALADSAALRTLRSRWSSLSNLALVRIIQSAQEDGIGLPDARRAADELHARHRMRGIGTDELATLHAHALNAGRQAEALRVLRDLIPLDPGYGYGRFNRVVEALYWDGDAAAARAAAAEFDAFGNRATPLRAPVRLNRACALGQWRLAQGDTAGIRQFITDMEKLAGSDSVRTERVEFCVAIQKALLEAATSRAGAARPALDRLDSLIERQRPVEFYAPVVVARLRRINGDPVNARLATRRRYYGGATPYLAPLLLEEARAAAAARHPSARARYEQYLRLRADPDPALRGHRDSVHLELRRFLETTAP